MPYHVELRKKVIDYIDRTGNVTKASKIFGISRASIYRWLGRKDLKPTVVKTRQRKINKQALYEDVKKNPDDKLIDRAKKFGVTISAISHAFKKMNITRKKKSYVIEKGIENKE